LALKAAVMAMEQFNTSLVVVTGKLLTDPSTSPVDNQLLLLHLLQALLLVLNQAQLLLLHLLQALLLLLALNQDQLLTQLLTQPST
jgi:hypothetical protein